MRPDMGKCVTERPRRGSRTALSAKARWYGRMVDTDEGPEYEGLTRLPVSRKQEGYHKKIGYKSFSDVLGPIEGYLRSSVGRRWDDVYSEMSKNLGQGSWPIRHVLTAHVDVATNTYRGVDGYVWNNAENGPSNITKYPTSTRSQREYYVEPETGILRMVPVGRGDKHIPLVDVEFGGKKITALSTRVPRVKMDDGRWMVRIKGLWFIGTYQKVDGDFRPAPSYERIYPEWPTVGADYRTKEVFTKEKQASRSEKKLWLGNRTFKADWELVRMYETRMLPYAKYRRLYAPLPKPDNGESAEKPQGLEQPQDHHQDGNDADHLLDPGVHGDQVDQVQGDAQKDQGD